MIEHLINFVWSVDFIGLLFGVAGTLLLATKGRRAGWGFVAFLVSNMGWILFALHHGHTKLLAQHLIFAMSSVVGIWFWLLEERVTRRLQLLFADPPDTLAMEDDVWKRWNGSNTADLSLQWNIPEAKVRDIVLARGRMSSGERVAP